MQVFALCRDIGKIGYQFIPWKKIFTSTMVSFSYLMSGSVSSEGERNVLGAIGLLYTICQVCTHTMEPSPFKR